MRYNDAMAEVRLRTQPTDTAVGRVRSRLALQLTPATAELARLPTPSDAAVARVARRLRQREAKRRPAVGWIAVGPVALAAAGLAMLATFEARPQPIDVALATATDLDLGPHVVATLAGTGHATGTDRDLEIQWESGRIELVVDPDQDVSLVVRTPEGTVEVTGTRFGVVRDGRGTGVEVSRGSVAVRCDQAEATAVTAGQSALCLPTTAAGWLARGRLLEADGDDDAALSAFDHGIGQVDPGSALGSELLSASVGPLLRTRQHDLALERTEAALRSDPGPRADELHRVAARLYLVADDCRGALPHLDALIDLTPEESAHRSRCAAR